MRDAPQYDISPEELVVVKSVVSGEPHNIFMLKLEESGWATLPEDEDALQRFRSTAYYKICLPRDTESWTDMHLCHLGVAMQKSVLFFALKNDRAEIHYR